MSTRVTRIPRAWSRTGNAPCCCEATSRLCRPTSSWPCACATGKDILWPKWPPRWDGAMEQSNSCSIGLWPGCAAGCKRRQYSMPDDDILLDPGLERELERLGPLMLRQQQADRQFPDRSFTLQLRARLITAAAQLP